MQIIARATRSAWNVPTADDAGVRGCDVRTWAGLLAPKRTPPEPPDIVAALNAAVQDVIKTPDVKTRIRTAVGGEVRGNTPDEIKALVSSEIAKWKAVVKRAKISRIDR